MSVSAVHGVGCVSRQLQQELFFTLFRQLLLYLEIQLNSCKDWASYTSRPRDFGAAQTAVISRIQVHRPQRRSSSWQMKTQAQP